jgi:hypothetical protein
MPVKGITMPRPLTLVVAILCAASLVSAQPGPYSKKVVSFVNKVIAPSSASLSSKHMEFIGGSVERNMNLSRFNFAPLPEQCQMNFRGEASGWKEFTPEKVKDGIDRLLAPELLRLIDENKEVLSRQNLSEVDRNTFLATKANAAGLSASQLESILNSGFFFVPYIESYSHNAERKVREVKNDKGEVQRRVNYTEYTHNMQLGVLWYQLKIDHSNKASVAYVGRAKGWSGSALKRSQSQDDGEEGNADWDAFTGVVDAGCKNIALETKRMEPFQLTGGVTETTGMGLMLSVGAREGVHLDDTYWIEEMEENDQGQIQKNKRGFVKIREVANNRDDQSAASYAQTITGSNYSPGLSATEIPLIGINLLVSAAVIPVKIGTFGEDASTFGGATLVNDRDYGFGLRVTSETKNAFGAMAAIQTSLAHATNISELWFHIGVQGGVVQPDGSFYFPWAYASSRGTARVKDDIGSSLTGSVNAGLLKKIYIKRFGLFLQADAKYALLSLKGTGGLSDANDDDIKYSLINTSFGGDFRAGLETYISPKVMFGLAAEYNLFGASDTWKVKVTDKDDKELMKKENVVGPEVNFGGLGFYAWINIAIPSFY